MSAALVTVAMIGCSATKLDRPAPARELYSSPLFRKSLAYAEHVLFAQHTFILSAKHGAVRPDAELAPYDLMLKAFEPWELADWAHVVGIQLRLALGIEHGDGVWAPRNLRFVLLASDLYLPDLPLGAELEKPLEGKQIGERLAFLKSSLAAVPRAVWNRRAA